MFNFEETVPHSQNDSMDMPDNLWAFPEDLFELPCNNHDDLPSTEWSGSTKTPVQGDVSKDIKRDITPSVFPEDTSHAPEKVISTAYSEVTRCMSNFTNSTHNMTRVLADFTAIVNSLTVQVTDLRKNVSDIALRVQSLDRVFQMVLDRERVAMEKYGDVLSQFQGAQEARNDQVAQGCQVIQDVRGTQGPQGPLESRDVLYHS